MFTGGLTLERMMIYGARIAVFLLIIPIHESAHGLMAKWLGDDNAEKEGRITPSFLFGSPLTIVNGEILNKKSICKFWSANIKIDTGFIFSCIYYFIH